MSLDQRADLVEKKGVLVGKRFYNHHKVLLYSVDRFFVETYFNEVLDKLVKIARVDHENIENYYLQNYSNYRNQ